MPKKRLTTNGNVFRRTDGRWQSVIWYFDEQGVKRRKVFSSKTKSEAQQKITTYIAQFNEEVRNSDESQKTIKESLTHWLQVFKYPSVERTTYDRLECTAQHQVFPLIGEKIVGDITAADLKSVLNHWMEQGYAYTTVKKVHILLNEFFRYLTEEGFIQKNPMQSVAMMKKANFLAAQDKEFVPEQEAVTVFTPTEIAKFKREAFATFANGKRKYQQAAAYILMLNTGLRTGELLGLLNSMYLTVFAIGALTTASEWRRIYAPAWKKIVFTLTFPLFMLTYIPCTVAGLFSRDVSWKPIEHTRAASLAEIRAGERRTA